jgi:asparagine synthase (glutamine-hydrolysing)
MPWLDVHWVTREGIDALTGLEERFATLQHSGGSYGFVNEALWAALAADGARLAMDGHGGDYTLNPRGQAALARLLRTGQFRRFVREFRAHRRATGAGWWQTVRDAVIKHAAPPLLRSYRRARRRVPWHDQPVRHDFAERMIAQGTIDPTKLRLAPRDQIAMRARLTDVVHRVGHGAGAGVMPARHGLTLTRPFHDRRVVELALAIPENLYVRNGRSRYLACRALADIYPREFQARWRRNDDEIPDFQLMVSGIKPRLLEDIARMERSERLSAMIDFPRIRTLLDARGPDDHNSGWEQETQLALGGYMTARFLEWFRRDNG